ncbi:MAG TPA: NAD(P)/FAD-dependent oxidoreductase [Bryobacteraceae bacterium]|nr:NAD(P)/FAD-dependent oxidoreductase [Bryobacteraceae bacterium]
MAAFPKSTDVFVVGGGPAGLAAAIAARLKGFDVIVADAAQPPIDKACGEGLMPDSFEAIGRLGIRLDTEQSFPFRGIRFHGAGISVAATFPREHGVGIRRTRLHELLIDRAHELGVSMLWGTRVSGLSEETVLFDDAAIRCRWVIGADGQNSRVRRWAGLDAVRAESTRYGFRRHYRLAPWTDHMEIYWGSGCQMYMTPVSPREVCAVVISRDSHLRLDSALQQFPELSSRLGGASSSTSERGSITASRRLRQVYRGRTILIGDASGSVDAITGEGLSLSFHQALALADAMVSGDLAAYQREHRCLARRPAFMGSLMLTLDRFPWLRSPMLHAMAFEPAIFAKLLAVHVGAPSPAPAVS